MLAVVPFEAEDESPFVGLLQVEAASSSSRSSLRSGSRAASGATMEAHYTHTTWRVKEGNEEEFVRRWGEWSRAPGGSLGDQALR
jgi:hypothetical protein